MLSTSKIKPIILCTIIPILVFVLWSLITYNNNDDSLRLHAKRKPATVMIVEPPPELLGLRLPDLPRVLPPVLPPVLDTVVEKREVKPTVMEQIRCMAHNIYYEAGGEPYMGQVAVARVVMNRVLHGFAPSPCKVIYQTTKRYDAERERAIIHCQFSWVCQGKLKPDTNSERYKTAEEIAEQVIHEDKWSDEIPDTVLFFHNKTVKPGWPYKHHFTIGNHLFYGK